MSATGTLGRVAALLACAAGALAAQAAPPAERVEYGVTRSADTVTVGDPFRVALRVRAPLGSRIEFPPGPDTTGAVQLLDPPAPHDNRDPGAVDQTVTYRVAAWDVEQQPVPLGELVVRTPAGIQRIAVPPESIYVRSVLPADSAQRVPKPVRDIFAPPATPAWLWWLLAAAAVVALLLLWWWWRRRRTPAPAPPVDAFARAQQEFERIERLALVDAGERGRHVALMVEVLRDYLEARFPDARLSHTSTELLLALRGRPVVPAERLGAVLAEADLVKFARRSVSAERARQLGAEARQVVQVVEEAVQRAAAAAEAAEREREARARGKAA